MTIRWPSVFLAAAACLLAVPLALGSAEARTGAGIGIASLVLGIWVVTGRLRRIEHGDDESPPSRRQLARELADGASRSFASIACIAAWLFVAVVAPGSGPRAEAGWPGPAMAAGVSVAVCGGLWSARKWSLRQEGVEREVFLRSTSTAFFVTAAGCFSYSLFEALAGAPPLPAWAPWNVGVVAWLASSAWYTRRAG